MSAATNFTARLDHWKLRMDSFGKLYSEFMYRYISASHESGH